ncbi:phosphodiesterase [Vibrio navarrensis]|nr:phosphodiesterase [Vibrio navarrensis]
MKLFFASDLHGCLEATKAMLTCFENSGAEHLILLGDLLNHGPRNPIPRAYNPPEVARLLNEYTDKIIAVRGNCDSEVDQMLLSFPMMMDYAWVLLEPERKVFLTHGHKYHAKQKPVLRAGDVLVHGHTHIPVAQWEEGNLIFNPGSVTFPREGKPASYGVYDSGTWSVIALSGETLLATTM